MRLPRCWQSLCLFSSFLHTIILDKVLSDSGFSSSANYSITGTCGSNDTLDLVSQSDIDQLNGCTTYFGDIIIEGNFASVTLPPSLLTISGGLGALGIPLTTLRAESLTKVGTENSGILVDDLIGPFAFGYMPSLSSLYFPNLTYVGGLFGISNNTSLQTIDGFPLLSHVEGSVVIKGNFTSISLPSLEYVGGNFYIESSFSSFECPFSGLEAKGVFHVIYFCGTLADASSNGTTNVTSAGITGYAPSTTGTGTAISCAGHTLKRSSNYPYFEIMSNEQGEHSF